MSKKDIELLLTIRFLFDKWHLGLARIIDFGCVAVLLIHLQRLVKPLAVRPLVMLGQSSLQVFCVHLLFCFGGLTLLGSATMLSGWTQAALFVGTIAVMLGTAKIFSRSEEQAERERAQVSQLTVGRLKAVGFKL